MKTKLFLLACITVLTFTNYQTIKFTSQLDDFVEFLLVDREIQAASSMVEMFKDSKSISKEELKQMQDRHAKAMINFGRIVDNFPKKYPTKPVKGKIWKFISELVNGTALKDYPDNPKLVETANNWYK